jgi:long-chain acyl-CoA synthetase
LGAESITYILEHTNLSTCFCSANAANLFEKTQKLGSLKNIVLFDKIDLEVEKSL